MTVKQSSQSDRVRLSGIGQFQTARGYYQKEDTAPDRGYCQTEVTLSASRNVASTVPCRPSCQTIRHFVRQRSTDSPLKTTTRRFASKEEQVFSERGQAHTEHTIVTPCGSRLGTCVIWRPYICWENVGSRLGACVMWRPYICWESFGHNESLSSRYL